MIAFATAEDALSALVSAAVTIPDTVEDGGAYDYLDAARARVLSELTALRSENARLRAALLRLADDDSDEAYAARAALDAKEGE